MDREPELWDLDKYLAFLNKETDRGLPLVAASMIEERLEDIIRNFLIEDKVAEKLISSFNSPLGTFSAKTLAAYSLGLIDENEYSEIETIRAIRNDFGHNWEYGSFESQSVKDRCMNLPWRGPKEFEQTVEPKERFRTCCSMLLVDLVWRTRLVKTERRVIKNWPNKTR